MTAAALLVAVVLALVHILGGRLASVMSDTHDRWISVGAGVTMAFVFLYLMPELDYFRQLLEGHPSVDIVDEVHYLAALGGVTLYYGLEHLAHEVRHDSSEEIGDDSRVEHDYVFWLHMGWYAFYNVIIGVLLLVGHQETVRGLALYGVAMAVHFGAVDAAMRRHHRRVYRLTGRWVLAVAVLTGWVLGAFAPISTSTIALVMAFLVGGLFINAIKDELPPSGRARFVPFVFGAVLFSAVLLAF